jgi:hypothetical protein
VSVSIGARVFVATAGGIRTDPVQAYGLGTYLGDFPMPGWDSPGMRRLCEVTIRRNDDGRDSLFDFDGAVERGVMSRESADLAKAHAAKVAAEERARPAEDRARELAYQVGLNPKILLERGGYVWGAECWWGEIDEDATEPPERFLRGRKVELVDPLRPSVRIQWRGRFAGWRRPLGVVYVGRGAGQWGRWGNPFIPGRPVPAWANWADPPGTVVRDVQHSVELYTTMLRRPTGGHIAAIRTELAGRNLACWCREDAPYCHADVILRVARGEEP